MFIQECNHGVQLYFCSAEAGSYVQQERATMLDSALPLGEQTVAPLNRDKAVQVLVRAVQQQQHHSVQQGVETMQQQQQQLGEARLTTPHSCDVAATELNCASGQRELQAVPVGSVGSKPVYRFLPAGGQLLLCSMQSSALVPTLMRSADASAVVKWHGSCACCRVFVAVKHFCLACCYRVHRSISLQVSLQASGCRLTLRDIDR